MKHFCERRSGVFIVNFEQVNAGWIRIRECVLDLTVKKQPLAGVFKCNFSHNSVI